MAWLVKPSNGQFRLQVCHVSMLSIRKSWKQQPQGIQFDHLKAFHLEIPEPREGSTRDNWRVFFDDGGWQGQPQGQVEGGRATRKDLKPSSCVGVHVVFARKTCFCNLNLPAEQINRSSLNYIDIEFGFHRMGWGVGAHHLGREDVFLQIRSSLQSSRFNFGLSLEGWGLSWLMSLKVTGEHMTMSFFSPFGDSIDLLKSSAKGPLILCLVPIFL